MADEHTVAGLMRKRAELAGQIEFFQTNLRQLVIDLDNLDATLRLFVPDIDLDDIKPKPLPPRHSAFRGELSRIVLDELRRAAKPATSRDIFYALGPRLELFAMLQPFPPAPSRSVSAGRYASPKNGQRFDVKIPP